MLNAYDLMQSILKELLLLYSQKFQNPSTKHVDRVQRDSFKIYNGWHIEISMQVYQTEYFYERRDMNKM